MQDTVNASMTQLGRTDTQVVLAMHAASIKTQAGGIKIANFFIGSYLPPDPTVFDAAVEEFVEGEGKKGIEGRKGAMTGARAAVVQSWYGRAIADKDLIL
jgi:hypothetical protein